jgi:hypothetical protein
MYNFLDHSTIFLWLASSVETPLGFEFKQRQEQRYQSHTLLWFSPKPCYLSLGKGKIRGKPSKRFSAVTSKIYPPLTLRIEDLLR